MDIRALGYLGFESPWAKAWEDFGPEIFGLGLAEPGNDGTLERDSGGQSAGNA